MLPTCFLHVTAYMYIAGGFLGARWSRLLSSPFFCVGQEHADLQVKVDFHCCVILRACARKFYAQVACKRYCWTSLNFYIYAPSFINCLYILLTHVNYASVEIRLTVVTSTSCSLTSMCWNRFTVNLFQLSSPLQIILYQTEPPRSLYAILRW